MNINRIINSLTQYIQIQIQEAIMFLHQVFLEFHIIVNF